MKILIVDDDYINRLFLHELLYEEYELAEAQNGQEAVQIIQVFMPDLILLDIMMPVMNGYEALHKIRQSRITSEISVIMVTAKTEKDDVKKAIKAGANDYIKKPIDKTELFAKIDIQKRYIEKKNIIKKYQVYANIHESMIVAQRVQESLLPDNNKFRTYFPDSFVLNLPKDIISGDFYSIYYKSGKKIISLFDCVGHGVPAGMMSIIVHFTISKYIDSFNITNPLEIVRNISIDFQKYINQSDDTFIDFGFDGVICEIDEINKEIVFLGARRPLIIIKEKSDELLVDNIVIEPFISTDNYSLYVIGGNNTSISLEKANFSTKKINYSANDTIYLFSDGYSDHPAGFDKIRISKRDFFTLLISNQNLTMTEQKLFLYNYFKKCIQDSHQIDDVLVVGIKL